MIAGYVVGTLSGVEVLGPSVLAIFTNSAESTWPNVAIATAVGVVMTVIAVVGIRITARAQVVMAVVEYTILVGMSIWGWSTCSATTRAPYPSRAAGSA